MIHTLITVRLALTTSGAVSAPERSYTSDDGRHMLPARRDARGQLGVPASTVAGSLRAHLTTDSRFADLFGADPGTDEPTASPLHIQGTALRDPAVQPLLATRARIDRHRGAPVAGALFTVEHLPAGTEIDVYLHLEHRRVPDLDVDDLLAQLRGWRPQLGRGASIGAGQARTLGVAARRYDLIDPDDVTAWLALDGPSTHPSVSVSTTTPAVGGTDHPAVLDVAMAIVDGLHLGTGTLSRLHPEDPHETRLVVGGHEAPRIPGSSLKGVLRSRVEYICRVLGAPACLDAACGRCRACLLFGHASAAASAADTGNEAHQERIAARGLIAVLDSPIDDAVVETRSHVALDRFTGGARDTALYTDQVVVAGTFRLRAEAFSPVDRLDPVDRGLLEHAVADLHDGLVGLGHATTRGYGTVRVDDPTWSRPGPDLLDGLSSARTPPQTWEQP